MSGPAIGAGLSPHYGAPRSSGRTLVVAASLLAVAIIGGTALFVVNRGSDNEPTSSLEAPAAVAGSAKTTALEPAAEPIGQTPTPSEKATERASVKDSVTPDELPAAPEPAVRAPVVRAPAPRPKPAAPARAKPAPAPAPAPEPVAAPKPAAPEPAPAAEAPKKKPPATRCECKPADLMCAMRCSAKK